VDVVRDEKPEGGGGVKISEVQRRLQAPFSGHLIHWKAEQFNADCTRAQVAAVIDARAVQDRLDAICPDDWGFFLTIVEDASLRTVKGSLTVLGMVREDIGEGGSLKAAASDAMVRCAAQFGIGRYLQDLPHPWVDWDSEKGHATVEPVLPEWARPDFERSPGGAHVLQAIEQLRYQLPADMDIQREVYRHLKAALMALDVPK
jgi:hypothetical protein